MVIECSGDMDILFLKNNNNKTQICTQIGAGIELSSMNTLEGWSLFLHLSLS